MQWFVHRRPTSQTDAVAGFRADGPSLRAGQRSRMKSHDQIRPDRRCRPACRRSSTTRAGTSSGATVRRTATAWNLATRDEQADVANRALLRVPRCPASRAGTEAGARFRSGGLEGRRGRARRSRCRRDRASCKVAVSAGRRLHARAARGRSRSRVGVAHAGWRGLAAGSVRSAARGMRCRWTIRAQGSPGPGPAIGPDHFEVGAGRPAGDAGSASRGSASSSPARASITRTCTRSAAWRWPQWGSMPFLVAACAPIATPSAFTVIGVIATRAPCRTDLDRSPTRRLTSRLGSAGRTRGMTGLTMLGALWRIARHRS